MPYVAEGTIVCAGEDNGKIFLPHRHSGQVVVRSIAQGKNPLTEQCPEHLVVFRAICSGQGGKNRAGQQQAFLFKDEVFSVTVGPLRNDPVIPCSSRVRVLLRVFL